MDFFFNVKEKRDGVCMYLISGSFFATLRSRPPSTAWKSDTHLSFVGARGLSFCQILKCVQDNECSLDGVEYFKTIKHGDGRLPDCQGKCQWACHRPGQASEAGLLTESPQGRSWRGWTHEGIIKATEIRQIMTITQHWGTLCGVIF